ncbi:hypothetical protein L6452_42735 [Arctium lappa]|uniref:Uncharacterized protein n=1 Tax=Arctium lappa TaxID=4217 RepID=A0ACB8XN72_ARCLA|nr:hypothetical protein L6452_42735 [Arctium lappa]
MEVRRETIDWPEMELIGVSTGPIVAGDGGEEGDHCLSGDGAHRRFYGTLLSPEMEVIIIFCGFHRLRRHLLATISTLHRRIYMRDESEALFMELMSASSSICASDGIQKDKSPMYDFGTLGCLSKSLLLMVVFVSRWCFNDLKTPKTIHYNRIQWVELQCVASTFKKLKVQEFTFLGDLVLNDRIITYNLGVQ